MSLSLLELAEFHHNCTEDNNEIENKSKKITVLGLMAAAVINRDLLKSIQDAYEQWQDHIDDDGLDPINATILRLA